MPDTPRDSPSEPDLDACRRELSALLRLAHDLGSAEGPHRLRRALEHAVQLVGVEGGLVWTSEPRTGTLHLASTAFLPPSVFPPIPEEVEAGPGGWGHSLAPAEPALTSLDAWSGPEALRTALRAVGVATVLEIPLRAHDRLMGVMVLTATRPRAGSAAERALAATLGTMIGTALVHAQEHAALIQEERMAALGRMAAGVAHELRNPLTMLLTRSELLRLKAQANPSLPSEEVARSATALGDIARRMQRIVESLSLYSKPPRAEREPLDAAPLLTAVLEMVQFSARTATVTLRMDASAAAGVRLSGDRSYLLQVLLNLTSNAIEAVPPGGLVTLSARPGDARDVVLEVADNGPGIPPTVQARIWEPFFTTKPEGTGLGLAIVRSLVREMGGTIHVDSRGGRGTAFRVTLPAVPTVVDADHDLRERARVASPRPHAAR